MGVTPLVFRNKARDLIGDTDLAASEFADTQIDGWRDDELKSLYAKGLFKRGNNIATEFPMTTAASGDIEIFYALPANFRRVFSVIALDVGTLSRIKEINRGSWNDLLRPGYIAIYNGDTSWKIRLFGEVEYTAIDDTAMPWEVVDVCLHGVAVRALTSEYFKRLYTSRSQAVLSDQDVTPGQIALGLQAISRVYELRKKDALSVQARSVR